MLILFVALILFGGDKFPEIARGLGKGIREFKDMSDGVKREIHTQINNYDAEKPKDESVAPVPPPVVPPAEIDYNMPPAYTAEAPKTEIDPAHELLAHNNAGVDPHNPVTNMPEHQVAKLEPLANAPKPTSETPVAAPKPDLSQPPNTLPHQSY